MRGDKSQLVQLPLTAITLTLILVALSMIWPGVMALFLAVLLLLKSCSVDHETMMLSWTAIDNFSIGVASLRRPGLLAILLR